MKNNVNSIILTNFCNRDLGTTVEFVKKGGGRGKNVDCWTFYRVNHLLISDDYK